MEHLGRIFVLVSLSGNAHRRDQSLSPQILQCRSSCQDVLCTAALHTLGRLKATTLPLVCFSMLGRLFVQIRSQSAVTAFGVR